MFRSSLNTTFISSFTFRASYKLKVCLSFLAQVLLPYVLTLATALNMALALPCNLPSPYSSYSLSLSPPSLLPLSSLSPPFLLPLSLPLSSPLLISSKPRFSSPSFSHFSISNLSSPFFIVGHFPNRPSLLPSALHILIFSFIRLCNCLLSSSPILFQRSQELPYISENQDRQLWPHKIRQGQSRGFI